MYALLLLFILFQLPNGYMSGQDLPESILSDYGKLNPDYEEVRYQERIVLPVTLWSILFRHDVAERVKFDAKSFIVWRGMRLPVAEYKGELLRVRGWPKCYGTQTGEQTMFYIEDVTFNGMTIRGPAGSTIDYTCRVISKAPPGHKKQTLIRRAGAAVAY